MGDPPPFEVGAFQGDFLASEVARPRHGRVPEKQLSFEEVDRQIQALNLSEEGLRGMQAAAATPAAVLPQVCQIYRAIRPILQGLLSLPIPNSWKQAIRTFISLMDLICPQ